MKRAQAFKDSVSVRPDEGSLTIRSNVTMEELYDDIHKQYASASWSP